MKKAILFFASLITLTSFVLSPSSKLNSNKTHIRFFSHTAVEDIEAHNYQAIATLDRTNGGIAFSVPMQGFQFEKALMQKHFNQPSFLDTKKYPKATFIGQITEINTIDFSKDGKYEVLVTGSLSLHGKTKEVKEKGTLEIKGGEIRTSAKFNILLADYDVVFEKGKPASNIAK